MGVNTAGEDFLLGGDPSLYNWYDQRHGSPSRTWSQYGV